MMQQAVVNINATLDLRAEQFSSPKFAIRLKNKCLSWPPAKALLVFPPKQERLARPNPRMNAEAGQTGKSILFSMLRVPFALAAFLWLLLNISYVFQGELRYPLATP